jgi:N-acyl-L-homoserine lactone synthetase
MKNTHPVFIKHTGESTYIFRVPYTKEELKALFHLRYKIFRETKGDFLFAENPYQLDLDVYDLHSYHFGLYKCEGDRQKCVGHIRLVVSDKETSIAHLVREIADDTPELNPNWDTPPQYALPHFQLIDDGVTSAIVKQAKLTHQTLIETSRYCTETEAQAIAIARFMVSSIVEASYHYFKTEGVVYVIVSHLHATFYKGYAFETLYEVVPKGANEKYVIMKITMDKVEAILAASENNPTIPLHRLVINRNLPNAA